MAKACLIIFFFFGITFISQTASARQPKIGGGEPQFSYLEPAKWADIGPGYKRCSTGTHQSPINIDTKKTVINNQLPPLKVVYQITNATLMTNGLVAQLAVKGKTEVVIDGNKYRLRNMRWHTPSEHTIDGKTFVAELHQLFMKTAADFDIVIIATVYLIGAPDPIVASIKPQMDELAEEMSAYQIDHVAERIPMNTFSGGLVSKIPTETYMKYSGSLTTPPCAENVTWFLTNPQTMTLEQAKQINALQSKSNKANARPTQPLNGRLVQVKV